MRKYIIIALVSIVPMFNSCNYLDFDESNAFDKQQDMYRSFALAESMLTDVYSYLPQDFGSFSGAMHDCATDDAVYVWSDNSVSTFYNGSWSPIQTVDDKWSSMYSAVRAANQFIDQIAKADFSEYQWTTDYESCMAKLKYWSYEARFLRAFYLFELAKRYGDIPIATNIYSVEDVNTLTKSTFGQVIDFISEECDSTAKYLPASFAAVDGKQTGRVTKGASQALKARALLYKASPLHNPSNEDKLWKEAAQAAQAIITSKTYSLSGVNNIHNNLAAKELIFERRNALSNSFEKLNTPVGFEGGGTGTCPTENLVESFYTKNGYKVTLSQDGWNCSDPAFNPAAPYANRDPRMYRTVIFDGDVWKGITIECFANGKNGVPLDGASPTGYYTKTYMVETVNLAPPATNAKHYWIYFRYAEVLLNYAEAMNEAFDADFKDATYKLSAREAYNQVRKNAAMPEIPVGVGKEQMKGLIQNERRCELAFEGHRFWDVRRWKIGEQTQRTINGVAITKNGTAKSYSAKVIENRIWNEKMNLYPISQREIFKNNNLLPNNFGW